MELNRNPENYFAQIEQATFAPSNFVPGIATSPDKMLLARIFSYADAHRYRVGTNHAQLPVNAPHAAAEAGHSYAKDGSMRYSFSSATTPVYAPNSRGGAHADPARAAESAGWEADGELTRSAATLHPEDDDFGQAGTLYREVFDDAARALPRDDHGPRRRRAQRGHPRARRAVLDVRRREPGSRPACGPGRRGRPARGRPARDGRGAGPRLTRRGRPAGRSHPSAAAPRRGGGRRRPRAGAVRPPPAPGPPLPPPDGKMVAMSTENAAVPDPPPTRCATSPTWPPWRSSRPRPSTS